MFTRFHNFLSVLASAILLATITFGLIPTGIARAAGIVNTCDEDSFDIALDYDGPNEGGLITFACNGTIAITSTKIIRTNTIIDATGYNVILDGGNAHKIFSVSSGVSLTLRNLTIQNAVSTQGSAVSMTLGGTLIIEDSQFLNNVATGVRGGALDIDTPESAPAIPAYVTIRQTLFENNVSGKDGGAIFVDGGSSGFASNTIIEISDSIFRNNRANIGNMDVNAGGGAIYANYHVTLNIEGTLFEGNQAGNSGGAIFSRVSPAPPNYTNLANNTFSDNSSGLATTITRGSGGAAVLTYSNLVHNTFHGNQIVNGSGNRGSAVYWTDGTTISRDNVFSANTGGIGATECRGGTGTFSGNLAGDTSCNAGAVTSAVTNLDTTLQYNGGPTDSHALQLGSNALDTAAFCTYESTGTNNLFTDGASITRDQRGAVRPFNGTCDKGAYELHALSWGTCSGDPLEGSHDFDFHTPTDGKVSLAVNTPNGLNCVTVEEMPNAHALGTPGILMTHYWWRIEGNIASGFDVDLTLPASFTPDTDDQVCRYTGDGTNVSWDCAAATPVGNRLRRDGVSEFSAWATQEGQSPTALTLSNFQASSNTPAWGVPLALGLVGLAGWMFISRRKR